jgi:hypothetical protein
MNLPIIAGQTTFAWSESSRATESLLLIYETLRTRGLNETFRLLEIELTKKARGDCQLDPHLTNKEDNDERPLTRIYNPRMQRSWQDVKIYACLSLRARLPKYED